MAGATRRPSERDPHGLRGDARPCHGDDPARTACDSWRSRPANANRSDPCPRCGKPVVKTGSVWQCSSNKSMKDDTGARKLGEGCGYKIFAEKFGKKLTDSMVRRTLEGKRPKGVRPEIQGRQDVRRAVRAGQAVRDRIVVRRSEQEKEVDHRMRTSSPPSLSITCVAMDNVRENPEGQAPQCKRTSGLDPRQASRLRPAIAAFCAGLSPMSER